MARPRTPLLSRDRIVAAALALADAEGLDALSTRRLATELSVSGPSLYNHFATKDELLDAVVDSVMGEVDLSMFGPGAAETRDAGGPGAAASPADWRTPLRDWARSYRAALAAHPNIVPVLAQGPGRRPNALRLADAVFGCLVDAGWPRGQATRIGALMRYFVTGSALASFAAGFPEDAGLYAAQYPHLGEAHLLAEHRRSIDEGAFETGLEALLDGLELRYLRTVDPGPAPGSGPGRG
ncbi:TetR family transcriptional regulator [Kitasatospora herbaricolor]|uniref:TetR/AcrR family transcriptional regulator n=1 Tax=Kitasatospora herbaricolor TaxID=68217 RepID=UPI00174C8B1D|nr:TetR/AcrR family transcriptional regulator [Kitasatospora herbaricolor]MDQ0311801.1 AcrR family transcriptional regulator [Kitasatospora herbaricolor]GGU96506.1 TetR family transcriptional regulator [Kitasatospora herbaricolor]